MVGQDGMKRLDKILTEKDIGILIYNKENDRISGIPNSPTICGNESWTMRKQNRLDAFEQ